MDQLYAYWIYTIKVIDYEMGDNFGKDKCDANS